MDILLDQETWDVLISGGRIVDVTDPLDEIKQRVAIAIRTQLGEWPFDISRGLPWLEEILVKAPSLRQIQSRMTAYLLTIEGVQRVSDLSIVHDHVTRRLTADIKLETVHGPTGPFKIKVAA